MATFIVSTAVRSLVLLLLTLGIAVAWRRRSAAVLHGIWAVGLGACLAIPVVTWLVPGWSLPLLPPQAAGLSTASIVTPVPTSGSFAPTPIFQLQENALDSRDSIKSAAEKEQLATKKDEPSNKRSAGSETGWQFERPSLATAALAVWLAGAAVVLVRLLQQVWVTQRCVQQAREVTSAEWLALRDMAGRQLGLHTSVALRTHRDALSPMVAGLLRPVVLLPGNADAWSSERRQLVLLHELAHVGRSDVQTQLMAALACAVYWFNPITWWGANQMKRLREIACDDAVVTHTSVPADYAQTLLEVAREYRSRQLISAVAMARTSRVEDRITAILDAARSRAVLTKRAVRLLTLVAFLAAVGVGTCQLSSWAADAEGENAHGATANGQDSNSSRTMDVHVLDEAGQPLQGAKVFLNIIAMEGEKRQQQENYFTDEKGRIEISLPKRLQTLQMWPSKPGYVPLVVNFGQGTHDEGHLIPDEYEFRLPVGHRLGGRVVDEDGNPISDAEVQVKLEPKEQPFGPDSKTMYSTWLDYGSNAVDTDVDGRWSIENAPAPLKGKAEDHGFDLWITHSDFTSDTKWGELQKQQGITTQALRDGTAEIKLQRGIVIKGVVTGPDGEPVKKGWVVWNDEPYFMQGDWETEIGEDGHFSIPPLSPGEYPITVVVPGYAAQRRMVKAQAEMDDLHFELKPGKRIEIHFVDRAGTPIPNAAVYLANSSSSDTWNNSNALHNHKHPNVPDYGIPRRANEAGVFIWDWAPEEAVKYEVGAKGFAQRDIRLIAKKDAHRVELYPPPTIRGKVLNAETGAPVERFRVIPVKAYRPDFYSTDFQANSMVEGKNGEYEIQFSSHGQSGNQYRVRIEADGYRTAWGQESVGDGDPPLKEDFRLEKVPALVGEVLDPTGKAVDDFTVAIGTPTTAPHFSIDRPEASFGKSFRVSGSNHFELAATFEPQRIRVFNDAGFVEVLRQPEEDIGTLQLQPWAKLSGRLMQGDKPIANEGISFYPLANRGLTEARFQDSFAIQTDPDGHFEFDRLPPMSGTVKAYLGPWQDSPLTSSQSLPLELKPGEHRELVLSGNGAKISGHVVATGRSNDELSKQWSLNYLISRDRGLDYPADAEPLSFDPTGPLQAAWLRQPVFENWAATRENHFVKLAEDGRLQIYGVAPGDYDLVIQLYEQPAGCLVETIGEEVVPISVSADESDAPIELGDIAVACHQGPRVGSDMRSFQFTDASGQVRHVDDMQGRCVLFHAWATWCKPCLQTMPEIKAAVEQYSEQPFTTVGLNLDQDAAASEAMAENEGWSWAQNYLGDDSELMRQLAISTVPAYYLIGPDGKLLGSANDWQQIEELLRTELP